MNPEGLWSKWKKTQWPGGSMTMEAILPLDWCFLFMIPMIVRGGIVIIEAIVLPMDWCFTVRDSWLFRWFRGGNTSENRYRLQKILAKLRTARKLASFYPESHRFYRSYSSHLSIILIPLISVISSMGGTSRLHWLQADCRTSVKEQRSKRMAAFQKIAEFQCQSRISILDPWSLFRSQVFGQNIFPHFRAIRA